MKIALTDDVVIEMTSKFREGISIPELMREYGWGRNKITAILKHSLSEDYREIAKKISIERFLQGSRKTPRRRRSLSLETRQRISLANAGKQRSVETRKKISESCKKNVQIVRRSNLESRVFNEILSLWSDAIHSFKLVGTAGEVIIYDVLIPSLNMIVEIHGDYWHCNPDIYMWDWFDKTRKMRAVDIWDFDVAKLTFAQSKGYNTRVLWQSHFRGLESSCEFQKVILEVLSDVESNL